MKKLDPSDVEFPLHLMRILEESEKEAVRHFISCCHVATAVASVVLYFGCAWLGSSICVSLKLTQQTADVMSNIPEHLRAEFEDQRKKIDDDTDAMRKVWNVCYHVPLA